ncbi:hypothetical protein V9T40_011584 [Parthenolecanium corni]|uniref:C-type lectin domain-containing protein n=1 Tax=Parthenolecanium corni TaxID=536013 RepID=A0AAN9XZM9_9HEMI
MEDTFCIINTSDVNDICKTDKPQLKLFYNITGKWFLPNPISPVFYLHFRDRISWIEADAVCQFHHSQLVTVNTATQFEDVRSYLTELYYEEPIWIGLRRLVAQGPFKWTNDSVLSTNEYWKEIPLKEEKLCVISSPSDNYRWTARQCNGPDVASFICEMPIPKWVQKSACIDSLNPTITVTFHPEKSMIKAGRVCQNTDVKYIECHDPQGKADKVKENGKLIKEHLNCETVSKVNKENVTQIPITRTSTTSSHSSSTISSTSKPSPTTPLSIVESLSKISSTSFELHSPKKTSNSSSANEFFNKNVVILDTVSETSTITLPQEMSFAEEPIKASKPFVTNGSTNGPAEKYNVTESPPLKSDLTNLNLIPTSAPTKYKPEKSVIYSTEAPPENNTSTYSVLTAAPSVLTNSTPAEESHEIFNSDKDRETFQNSGVVKKSVKMEVVENVPNSLKSIVSKSSEEEAALSDRTYNIEGTFDSDDFVNGADPINVYKKIDLNPLDSVTKESLLTSDPVLKSSEYPSTPSIPFQSADKGLASVSNEERPVTATPNYNTSSEINPTNFRVDLPLNNQTTSSPNTSPKPRKASVLLSGALDDEISPKRKRRVVNTDRRSSYPYFLGRILG